jgi:hypothetical protein
VHCSSCLVVSLAHAVSVSLFCVGMCLHLWPVSGCRCGCAAFPGTQWVLRGVLTCCICCAAVCCAVLCHVLSSGPPQQLPRFFASQEEEEQQLQVACRRILVRDSKQGTCSALFCRACWPAARSEVAGRLGLSGARARPGLAKCSV